jgi:transcription elongation factor GreA-like protein
MPEFLTPGAFVRHPDRPDWGIGQIQSVTGARVTVNFEGAGKVLILSDRIALLPAEPEAPATR